MYIHIKATTGAKHESLVEIKPLYFAISVKQKAERNTANERIIELLQIYFKTKNIRIINGHRSPTKLVSVGE
jgi:uncharacterized protein YggU (UPF0235/DUF167 family)